MEPDIIPAPLGLKTSPSNINKLTPARKPATTKFTPEMVLSVSQPSLSIGAHLSKMEGMSTQTDSFPEMAHVEYYKFKSCNEQIENYA